MRDYSTLPEELIDAITEILHNNYDGDGLLACSLVCRSWLPSSQRLLCRWVALALDRDDCKLLARSLLSSPHLSDYIRELKVYWHEFLDPFRTSMIYEYRDIDQSLHAAVLRKLSKLQRIELYKLDWSLMKGDLPQSLRWVLMLPSVTFLTLDITGDESGPVDFFQHPLTREDQGENDESRPALERRHLSHLHLCLGSAGNCDAYVDWFLGPRSHFDVSHIQTLRVDRLREVDEQALNHLLRTIGTSLKRLEFYVPFKVHMISPELGFNIKLEFNPNIRVLRLTNISIAVPLGEMSRELFGIDWLLCFLSHIDTSNKLEQIEFRGLMGTGYREACSPSGWGQVDCLLAGKFRKLQKLDIKLSRIWDIIQFEDSEIARCMLDTHPLLVGRGVSVNVGGEFGGSLDVGK
ncbi:hypothetical protein JB92DRAFT_3106352 [Gautieria morchelliformis]|nr:hypothetical protein JB92DRAFT_3106352 [Gautieria morchelliformis]